MSDVDDDDVLARRPPGSERDIVGNEFAEVAVTVDSAANGTRLLLRDLRTGQSRRLDALELETLVWLPQEHLYRLLDPGADRWREGDN